MKQKGTNYIPKELLQFLEVKRIPLRNIICSILYTFAVKKKNFLNQADAFRFHRRRHPDPSKWGIPTLRPSPLYISPTFARYVDMLIGTSQTCNNEGFFQVTTAYFLESLLRISRNRVYLHQTWWYSSYYPNSHLNTYSSCQATEFTYFFRSVLTVTHRADNF